MSDSSPAHEEESRQMLRVIGHARGSPRILQEASNGQRARMTCSCVT
jgi:hypothetical protein